MRCNIVKIKFLQPSYEDRINQKYIRIKENNESEDYVGGLFVPINGKVGKIYYRKNDIDVIENVNENTIYVAKQPNFIDTIRVLLHELTHFIILKFLGDWQLLQKLLDKDKARCGK